MEIISYWVMLKNIDVPYFCKETLNKYLMKFVLIFEVFKKVGENNYVLSYARNVCKLHIGILNFYTFL